MSNSGERSSEIHTVGGAKNELMRCRSSSGSRLSGDGTPVITLVQPRYTAGPRKTSSCAQWYSGSECSIRSSAVISPSTMQLTYCQITASCDSIAPLGSDSVPLV